MGGIELQREALQRAEELRAVFEELADVTARKAAEECSRYPDAGRR
jgi:hypothetical protein